MLLWTALAAVPLAHGQTSPLVTTFGGSSTEYVNAVAVDASGNTYVTGEFNETVDFDPDPNATASRTANGPSDVFLVSYDAAGALRYVTTFGSTGFDYGYGVTVDASGNAYVTGEFKGTVDFNPDPSATENRTSISGGSDVFLASYDAAGALRYVSTFGGNSTDSGYGVAVDASGNAYVTGYFYGTADFNPDPSVTENRTARGNYNAFLASYDAAGALRYVNTFGGTGSSYGRGMAVDASGNTYMAGYFYGTADFDPDPGVTENRTSNGNTDDAFLASYDAAGALRYVNTFGGTGTDRNYDVAVDASGNAYVAGFFRDTADFDPAPGVTENRTSNGGADGVLVSYNAAGALRYVNTFGGITADYVNGVAVDASGNAYVAGSFEDTVDFDPDPSATASRTSNARDDAFLASYDAVGALRYVRTFGGNSYDRGRDVAVDASGNAYATGYFSNTVDFDPNPSVTENRASNGSYDVFLVRYNADGVLPVELTAFTAALDGRSAILSWTTASETGNTGFDVQIDAGQGFRSAGWVDGAGTTLEESSYAFRTSDLAPGTYRFRLEQVDLDGATEFSPVVELAVVTGHALALTSAQPNPFGGRASVTLSVGHVQTVRVALYDALGREVAVLHSGEVDGSMAVAIDGASLPGGVYVVRAQGEAASVSTLLTRVR